MGFNSLYHPETNCFYNLNAGFLWHFRDLIWAPRIENRVPTIRENHHWVPRIKENRVPIIREIGSLQVHIGYLTFSLKKTCECNNYLLIELQNIDWLLTCYTASAIKLIHFCHFSQYRMWASKIMSVKVGHEFNKV